MSERSEVLSGFFDAGGWFPSMPNSWLSLCRVCAFEQDEAPWGSDGWTVPSFAICPCCGCEFGVEDEGVAQVVDYRIAWLKDGAEWFDSKRRPSCWDLASQLALVPPPFAASAVVTSVEEFEGLLSDYGPSVCASASFSSEELFERIITMSRHGAWVLSYAPYMDTAMFRKILRAGDRRAVEVLRNRPELSWREGWRELLERAVGSPG